MRTRSKLMAASLAAALALATAACGDDKPAATTASTAAPSSSAPATDAPPTESSTPSTDGGTESTAAPVGPYVATAEGCEGTGATDPMDMSLTRKPARCKPGFPAPQPLPEMTEINVSAAFTLEYNAPFLLADTMGEFAKENIKMNFINMKLSDAIPQLIDGKIDVGMGGLEIALFAAGNNDWPVRAVLANYYPQHAGDESIPQTGLWCNRDSFDDPENPDLSQLEELKLASTTGKGSVSWYYVIERLRAQTSPDFSLADSTIELVPSSDMVTALENGAIDCGIILDPLWMNLVDNPKMFLAAAQTPGEPLGVHVFGKRLLEDRPDIGDAVARAFLRTVNTYFAGDYHADAAVMEEISKVTSQPLESLTRIDSPVVDWEYRKDTSTRVQQVLLDLGVITDWTTPVPEDKIIDRGFYLRAVGAHE